MGIHIKDVIIDDPSPNGYIAGTYLKGRVVIESSKSVQIAGITLNLEGRGKVSFLTSQIRRFKEKKQYNPITGKKEELSLGSVFDVDFNSLEVRRHLSDSAVFTSKEKYCDVSLQITGETTLPPDRSSHHFSLLLPDDLPSSIKSKFGDVKYKIKVKVIKLKKLSTCDSFKSELKVVGRKDVRKYLVNHPNIFEGSSHCVSKEFSTFFMSVGKLTVSAMIPRSVFPPSNTVMIKTQLVNQSDVNISAVILRLVSCTACVGKRFNENNVLIKDEVLVELEREGVSAKNSSSFVQQLIIPHVKPICLDSCSIMKVYYLIKIEAVADGLHSNLTLVIPIDISPEFEISPDNTLRGFPEAPSTFDFVPPRQPPSFGFVQSGTSNDWASGSPHTSSFTMPTPPNIGFISIPSAPQMDYNPTYPDPPPPYPGVPDSIPNYETAMGYPSNHKL